MQRPRWRSCAVVAVALVATLILPVCGGGGGSVVTRTLDQTRVEVLPGNVGGRGFQAQTIYAREAPGVVTVISVFGHQAAELLLGSGGAAAVGTGFVVSAQGEIVTNAHVVAAGQGSGLQRARQVFVQFADRNQVPATIVGTDPNADVALLRINPAGLTLRPLPLGDSDAVAVGEPVAAIGSPFDEPGSLSIGVISGLHRTIDSLTQGFSIEGAIQTDAAINHGNSGGPLVDANGRVIGINAQIRSSSGGGEGVGFAIPVNQVKHSIDQLRAHGRVAYAYLGVSSSEVYPQLAQRFHLGVDHGAWVQRVDPGAARNAGVHAGSGNVAFETGMYAVGGDVIIAVNARPIQRASDLSRALAAYQPGQTVAIDVQRGLRRLTLQVTLGARPAQGVSP